MSKIRILPDVLVSKISAGEVVERPASVVKELIENSIDACSSRISVFLQSGGKRNIRVVDNGQGMTKNDALMSIERHATSKIKEVEDLYSLNTLGFRGEALPSIVSVSRFRIITKTSEMDVGVEVDCEGGIIKRVKEIACNTGTSIEVSGLFYNMPARLKFLKKTQTELMRVLEIIQREAISKPGVSFEIFSESKNLCNYKSSNLKDRIKEIIPNTELYPFELEKGAIKIRGYLGSPLETRTVLQKLYTYVNNRPVRDRFINKLVIESYGNLIEKGRYPQGLIFITTNKEDVDVNVHPTKIEVKFRNHRFVGKCIQESIRNMLADAPWIKGYKGRVENALGNFYDKQKEYSLAERYGSFGEKTPSNFNYGKGNYGGREAEDNESVSEVGDYDNQKLIKSGYYCSLNIIGQVGKLYLICESEKGIIIVDQHAAHERVNFEKVKKAYLEESNIHCQELLIPEILELTFQEMSVADSYSLDIARLGFNFEKFGEKTIRLRSVPGFLLGLSYKDIFPNLLNELDNFGEAKSVKDQLDLVCATIACHKSITANQKLSKEEVERLFEDLDKTEFPHFCPHGRPISTEITYNRLEKLFKRI